MDLQNLFIKSDLSFVIYMTFIKTSKIFTTEDFIIKIVYDMVNDFQKKKAAEDLLEYLSNDKKAQIFRYQLKEIKTDTYFSLSF